MNLEIEILKYISGLHMPLLDKIMIFITSLGNSGLVFIAIGIILMLRKKSRREGINILLALGICFIFGNVIMKPLIARARPFTISEVELLIKAPTDFSFPSGHTYSAFAAAMSSYFYNKKRSIALFIFAIVMGFSRLYLYVHYPTDVFVGALFGIGCAILAKYILDTFTKKTGIAI
ncbi:undecaprenyl-diphosphatase [Anaerosphaera aminiphila DSM 21120]|uniref:Undecaprenyl-diphosphatase n=1 Tax=Anaerosphaera aminiphila DSM 21120 TaxID=1120995 RepID=A0A1M5SSB4_9FIRM|nr:phosphatase PAP2 family protein [Anaerosphaera aminiphila]SHH41372.1 undecaprenyl-diphosphatase [Anaerosphaera aminiphila DSM 21120]